MAWGDRGGVFSDSALGCLALQDLANLLDHARVQYSQSEGTFISCDTTWGTMLTVFSEMPREAIVRGS